MSSKDPKLYFEAVRSLLGNVPGWHVRGGSVVITDASLTAPTSEQIETAYTAVAAADKKEKLILSAQNHINKSYPIHKQVRDLQKRNVYNSFFAEAGITNMDEAVRGALGKKKDLIGNIGKNVDVNQKATDAADGIQSGKISKLPGRNNAARRKNAKKMIRKMIEVDWKDTWIEACHIAAEEAIENNESSVTLPAFPTSLANLE